MTSFPTDYDKENPLTIKAGQLRLIELQIASAKEKGDDETLKMLEGQKENVNQGGGVFQQMLQYQNTNAMRQASIVQATNPVQFHQMMHAQGMQMAQQNMMMMHQHQMIARQQQMMMFRSQAFQSPHFQQRAMNNMAHMHNPMMPPMMPPPMPAPMM